MIIAHESHENLPQSQENDIFSNWNIIMNITLHRVYHTVLETGENSLLFEP